MKLYLKYVIPLFTAIVIISGCGKENQALDSQQGSRPETSSTEDSSVQLRQLPLVFEGTDKGRPCRMMLHREWYEGGVVDRKNYRAELSTSYEHDGEGLGKQIVAFSALGDGKLLEWDRTATREFIKLALKAPSDKMVDPASFRVKWLHDDHLHDNTCINVKLVP